MRVFAFAAAVIGALGGTLPVSGFEVEDQRVYPGSGDGVLRIISTADLDVFDPILRAYQIENPAVSIDYTVTGTSDLRDAIEGGAEFDLAISSAMDLQTKLVNDGFAQSYASPASLLPDWATWRNRLFGFTQEPAVMIVSDSVFAQGEAPRTRDDLIAMLRDNPARFQGKIGTYDVRRSGFGYLVATQDSRNGEAFWRLMEVMGRLDARLYCCSGEMIDDVASGRLALAYNVLGSYAAARLRDGGGFRIVALDDYVHVMLRTVLIPETAQNLSDAHGMIDFLTALNTRPELVAASGLPALDAAVLQENPALRPIRFGPGLLVFLDQLKRSNFLRSWESSLVQE